MREEKRRVEGRREGWKVRVEGEGGEGILVGFFG
jgi:hypothetical protein